jgi:aspartyl-tRNA(Asn)/glutamyl-tRNA(Gln) amidotransferase subunit A
LNELLQRSATALLTLYRSGETSPTEVVAALFDRVAALNPKLNAFCWLDRESAQRAAAESTARWLAGAPQGPLDGVPVSIKDLILTRGMPTRRGSLTVDPGGPWNDDAPLAARLRAAGAVIFGKTTTPEFGWKGVTESQLTGVTRNPWNADMTSGGSSGGAGAQVASGMGPIGIGTDGGGSIRIPSAYCGIVGFKPSYGRIPLWPASPVGTLAHAGPMTRTVADAALVMSVVSGPHERDWTALPEAEIPWRRKLDAGIAGKRIAFSPSLGLAKVGHEIATSVAIAVRAFEEAGATVELAEPDVSDAGDIFELLWNVGCYGSQRRMTEAQLNMLEPALREVGKAGVSVSIDALLSAQEKRAAFASRLNAFHRRFDLLVTPTMPSAAFPVGTNLPLREDGEPERDWSPFTYPFNLSQQPCVSVPCGFTSAGLPIGLQIVGPPHNDMLVLQAARAYEQARPFASRWPRID